MKKRVSLTPQVGRQPHRGAAVLYVNVHSPSRDYFTTDISLGLHFLVKNGSSGL